MKRGFTILEVLIASIILGLGLTSLLVSFSIGQKMMLSSAYLETAHEVMELGEIAYPIEDVTSLDDMDVSEIDVDDLWSVITGASHLRLTKDQEEKFKGYTWERKLLDKNPDDDEVKRMGGIHPVRITVRWGGSHFTKEKEEESYILLWREPKS